MRSRVAPEGYKNGCSLLSKHADCSGGAAYIRISFQLPLSSEYSFATGKYN